MTRWNYDNRPPVNINKTCSGCGEKKSIELFHKSLLYGDKRGLRCKICSANSTIRSKRWNSSAYIDNLLFNTEAYAYPPIIEPFAWDHNGFILTESGDDPMTSIKEKKCTKCGHVKYETQFHVTKNKQGRRTQCKQCVNANSKKNRGPTMAELAQCRPAQNMAWVKHDWEKSMKWHQARERQQDVMHRRGIIYPSNDEYKGAFV